MSQDSQYGCSLLVISPHTDDAEIGVGGIIALLAEQEQKVWTVDLTSGELASNATCDERWQEAADASRILGLTGRARLRLPDGFIDSTSVPQIESVVGVIRSLRPRWIICAPDPVRHPDHITTPVLVKKAIFLARLVNLKVTSPDVEYWEAGARFFDMMPTWQTETMFTVCKDREEPSVIFDVSNSWSQKMQSLHSYRSQFSREEGRQLTKINDAGFLEKIKRRGLSWGHLAGCQYAEALHTEATPVLSEMPDLRWK